jgi:hypothetical protein
VQLSEKIITTNDSALTSLNDTTSQNSTTNSTSNALLTGSSNDILLISVMVGVGVILLCAVSCGIWKIKTKYEFVGGKFKVKESYIKKREAQQKKL